MDLNNIELWNSYFKGFSTDEKVIILTLITVRMLKKATFTNEEIEWLFIHAKADLLRFKDGY